MQKIMKCEGIIFDLDGVVVDTDPHFRLGVGTSSKKQYVDLVVVIADSRIIP